MRGAGKPGLEFCSLLNDVLRGDDAHMLSPACVLVRAINQVPARAAATTLSSLAVDLRLQLCVLRFKPQDQRFPPGAVTHRGGGLPLQHLPFFVAGLKFRIPAFFATSFNHDKAYQFLCVRAARLRVASTLSSLPPPPSFHCQLSSVPPW